MKNFFLIGILILSCLISNSTNATMVIPPATGGGYLMEWSNGLGQIDSINGNSAHTDWSITVSESSTMTYVKVGDLGAAGDEFALYMDGVLKPWTTVSYDASGYFRGEYDNLLLSTGTHIITFYLTKIVADSGNAGAEFSGVTSASVPEPTTLLLLASGLVGLIGFRRKFRK